MKLITDNKKTQRTLRKWHLSFFSSELTSQMFILPLCELWGFFEFRCPKAEGDMPDLISLLLYVCLPVRLVPSTCICTVCGSNSYLIRPSQCSALLSGRALSLVLSLKASTLTSSVTWRQHAPLKRLSTVTRLHGAVSQKAVIFSLMQVFIISFFVIKESRLLVFHTKRNKAPHIVC
jgi:hypothetical protein